MGIFNGGLEKAIYVYYVKQALKIVFLKNFEKFLLTT